MKDVVLYLGGKKVDWSAVPDILLTYQRTDYTNPTVTKNMYSKTVTIEGTQNNDILFNHIWQLDRIQNGVIFNPSQRVQFELYNNGEIVEKGYAKLDSVTKEGYKLKYNLTLYGGLGSFFYNLSYDVDSDKERTMADLNYTTTSDPDSEFDFEINKTNVNAAWNALSNTGNNSGNLKKWDYINFVPCYNGLPETFDSNRVLINTKSLSGLKVRYTDQDGVINGTFPTTISDGEQTYTPKNGYVQAEMLKECDEWEMRDLRSYLQRPALSVKGFFNAISNPINNGGYNVVLDKEFFSNDNPYYNDAWITLSILNPEGTSEDNIVKWDCYKGLSHQFTYPEHSRNDKNIKTQILSVNPINGTPNTFVMDIEVHCTIPNVEVDRLYTSTTYLSTIEHQTGSISWSRNYRFGGALIQLYGYADGGEWYSQSGRCGSNYICLTSKTNNRIIPKSSINDWGYKYYDESDIQYSIGYWQRTTGDDFVWHNEDTDSNTIHIVMDTNLMSEIPNIAMGVSHIMTLDDGVSTYLLSPKCGLVYEQSAYVTDPFTGHTSSEEHSYWSTFDAQCLSSNMIYSNYGKMRSYTPVTKKDLLGGLNGTPCDWLLSYCKLFGLFLEKDKLTDTIYIKLRNNWYKNEIVDLDAMIDRSKTVDITPLTFESKWYNFNYAEAESKFMDKYKDTYSQDFGKQMIDTNYNFDADEISLLENNKYRNGLMALEKSNYFNTKTDANGNQILQCLFNWCTAKYYNDSDTLETNICLPQQNFVTVLNPEMPNQWYDFLPKLQMKDKDNSPTEGDGVLVFFNGLKNTDNADYWISDDVDEMFMDSENPCWLQTVAEYNLTDTEQIAIHRTVLPDFSRYVLHNNMITATWDFGHTKELYVPYYRYDINRTPTVYENFWRSYIRDLYSVNTRKVDCYVAMNSNDVNDFMKKFYLWDNCLWVCTKVQDYDIALEKSTLCSFTKVNDKDAYLSHPTFDDFFLNFYRSDGVGYLPAQGTDDERSFYMTVESSSNWGVLETGLGFATLENDPSTGTYGTHIVKATFAPNKSNNIRQATFMAGNADGMQKYITVYQSAYVKPKYLTFNPDGILLPKTVTSAVTVELNSSNTWYCTGGDWATVSPNYGQSGITNLSVSATTNNGNDRLIQVLFNNADGETNTLNIKQKGYTIVTIEQNEIFPVTSISSSSGNVHYRIVNDVECQLKPLGNTANYCIASGLVSYNTTIAPSGGTNFWFHFSPNTSTVSRNAGFYLDYAEDGGRYAVYPTKVKLPLRQEASGNSIVTLTGYTSQNIKTNLGAQYPWEAYTSARWITLTSNSGTSANTFIDYSVSENTGGYRVGYIYVAYTDEMGYTCQEVIEVRQNGVGEMVVTPSAITATKAGGDYLVYVSSPSDYSVSNSTYWLGATKLRDNAISVHIEPNNGNQRTGNVTITDGSNSTTVLITQEAATDKVLALEYLPQEIVFDASGGTAQITIRSNSDWIISE